MSRLKRLILTVLGFGENKMKNWFWQNAQGTASEASTLADLIDAARRGEIGAPTQVSNDGETWKSAEDVPAFADALGFDVSPTSGAEGERRRRRTRARRRKRGSGAVARSSRGRRDAGVLTAEAERRTR